MDTTKLDDLLNQAEAQESEQSQWIEDINYITKNFYVDEHGVVEVKNKAIGDMSKHISVKGESYSQYIEFKIGRFFDGIDLTKMKLAIYFSIPGVGEDESRPINVYYNENEIKFGWVIPPEVAQTNLTIEFCIYARGKLSDGNDYVLKTKTATYQINDGLEIGSGIIKPTNNWYLNFVLEMDQKVSQASESADRAEQAASSLDGVVETVTTARDEVVQKASTVNTQHSEVESWHQEAEQFRNEAEQFRNEAEAITGIGLAEEGKPGIVQPDGVTTKVTEDGKMVVIGGGSGGGGTTDYQALENKPSIAGVELNGDKSYDELGIASKEAVARNFETVNQNIQELDDYTQSLGEDVVSLDTELEATSEKLVSVENELQKTTTKVDTIIEKADLGIKETASGEEIHLTDSAEGKAVEFALYGKAKQKTTTGKNIFDLSNTNFSVNSGGTFTKDKDKLVVTTQAEVSSGVYTYSALTDDLIGKTLTFSADVTISDGSKIKVGIEEGASNSTLTPNVKTRITQTHTLVSKKSIIVYSVDGVAKTITLENIQIEVSNTATDYEPFTGGQPSPNPSYPQEIEVSGESYNLLENKATSKAEKGVEFVVNEDKSITANGTATANLNFIISELPILPNEKLILSGCKGGSANTYSLSYTNYTDKAYFDVGNGIEISKFDYTSYPNSKVQIEIKAGTTCNNVVFYPMIRKASVKNDRYMPYGKGSVEVKSVGKNLLNYKATYKELNGITWTVNGDKTITANGTATENSTFMMSDLMITNEFPKKVVTSTGTTYSLQLDCYNSKTYVGYIRGSGEIPSDTNIIRPYIRVKSGETVNNLTFYPMIRACDENGNAIDDDTYEPYKETLATIPTDGLAGIPVSSNGNYTDQNGQQWICDEVVKYADGSGVFVQRVKKILLPTSWEWTKYNYIYYVGGLNIKDGANIICSHFVPSVIRDTNNLIYDLQVDAKNKQLRFMYSAIETVEDFKAWLQENNVIVYYVLDKPITTPLTSEEVSEISTFYPVTNISNDFDCGMRIEYVGDSIITTNTEIPIVIQNGELESGDNIVTILGKIANKLNSLAGSNVQEQLTNIITRLSALEQNQKTIIYSDTEPETVEENTIVMVYETEE